MRVLLLKLFNEAKTFQEALNVYSTYYNTLDQDQQRQLSGEFWKYIESLTLPIVKLNTDGSHQVYFLYRKQQENSQDLYIQGDFHVYRFNTRITEIKACGRETSFLPN